MVVRRPRRARRIYSTGPSLRLFDEASMKKGGCRWERQDVNFLAPEPLRLWAYCPGAALLSYWLSLRRPGKMQQYKPGTMGILLTSCRQAVTTASYSRRHLKSLWTPRPFFRSGIAAYRAFVPIPVDHFGNSMPAI